MYTTHLQAPEGSVDRRFQVVLAPLEGRGHQHLGELVLALVRLDELHQVYDRVVHLFDQIVLLRRGGFTTLNPNDVHTPEREKFQSQQPVHDCFIISVALGQHQARWHELSITLFKQFFSTSGVHVVVLGLLRGGGRSRASRTQLEEPWTGNTHPANYLRCPLQHPHDRAALPQVRVAPALDVAAIRD